MRLIRLLAAIACLVAGIAVGALNPQPIALDLGLATFRASLGVAVLAALLAGVVLGGLILTVSAVLPLRQRLRRATANKSAPPAPSPEQRL
ncbi:LapA family protein [Luteimonas sp. SX5]|uniref:LapA family protein n=1 Tax=Luteimonas galliterrae TaxID=2940486 RepID=A0ABT0MFF4_9GAMM|nr:LapA family protein [Luteimonas galliterrae]MCL1633586.1 LapA family protein [Luteimonas galliterrae]